MSLKSKLAALFAVGLVMSIIFSSPLVGAVAFIGLLFSQYSFKMNGFAYTAPNLDIVGACERIRKEASTLAGKNYAFNLQRKTGALDFITSPENGGVDAKLISYDSGKKLAKLYILYDQRTKACEITHDCYQSVCDDGSTPVRKDATITIDDCIKTPVRQYSNDDMVGLCNNTEEFMRTRGFNDLRAAREYFSEKILAELVGQIGINKQFDGGQVAAATYKTLDLIGADSNSQPIPLPGNFAKIPLDYENNQLTGTPWVVGQGNFELFWKLHGMSCCNATTPYGEANLSGDVRFYKDQAANSVLGTNRVLVGAFGAVHLLTWNENRNIVSTGVNSPDRFNIVIPDPAGYPFDWNLDFYFDNCTKTWKSMYSLTWGLFNTFRNDSFAADGEASNPDPSPDCNDELDGMLGVFGYNIT
jgi:hypothetical protein